MGLTVLVAYGPDSPGWQSWLRQRNTVNTAVQTDQEATPHVSWQPDSAPGTTHPQEIDRSCRQPVVPFPDFRYRMVSTPIYLLSTDTGMSNPFTGSIPALDCHLSNGITEDQLLCQARVLRFYLERSMPWREHKRLLFVLFKPVHKRDIVTSTTSGWIRKTILECYTKPPIPLLESHKVKAHQVRSMAASLAQE